MLTSLRQLEGLPAVWQDRLVGFVERGVPDDEARRLNGLIIRKGLGTSRWVDADSISTMGKNCILLREKPEGLAGRSAPELHLAYLTSGRRIGPVTDGILCRKTLKLLALEISPGPLHYLRGRNAYAMEYHVVNGGLNKGQTMVNSLLSWTELQAVLGKEEKEWT